MPDSTIALCYMLRTFTDTLKNLLVYPEKMEENFSTSYGLTLSQTLLLALTGKGLTREEAYKLVQQNAMKSWEHKVQLKEHVLKDQDILRHLSAEEIEQLFSSENILNKLRKSVDIIFARNGL